MKTVAVADLGGTKCRFALLSEDAGIHAAREVPTPTAQDAFLDMLRRELAAVIEAPRAAGCEAPVAVGIGVAGVVTKDLTSVVYTPNLPLDGVDVAGHLREALHLPAALINDGRASALGEFRYGDAAGCDPLLVLFFGTGIGIGVIVDGAPFAGAANAAGEAGHVLHLHGGLPCPCGRRGCFEAYCGGGPMVARAAAAFGAPPDGAPRWRVDHLVALAAREPRAQAILDDAATAAGALVASLCTLMDPAAVVLGGGVFKGWPALRGRIEDEVRGWCSEIITRDLRFVPSRLESDAILIGAAEVTGAFR